MTKQDNPVPTQQELEEHAAREQLAQKERAITAGLVVELEPHEADALGVTGMDEVPHDDPEFEQALMESRFDPCEFDLENYELEPEAIQTQENNNTEKGA